MCPGGGGGGVVSTRLYINVDQVFARGYARESNFCTRL